MKNSFLIKEDSNLKSLNIFLFYAIIILGFSTSCTIKPAVIEGNNMTKAEYLAMGKTVYKNSCAKCHDLPNPTDHSAQDWVGIMNRMAPAAKLSDRQHDMVYDYIVSVQK